MASTLSVAEIQAALRGEVGNVQAMIHALIEKGFLVDPNGRHRFLELTRKGIKSVS